MSEPYDGLPLNTPTLVAQDANVEVWATRTSNGGTVEHRAKPGGPADNRNVIQGRVVGALVRLRQIKTQAQTFQAQVPYAAANLAALNDLLTKTQAVAGAVNDVADDLIAVVRFVAEQFDSTT